MLPVLLLELWAFVFVALLGTDLPAQSTAFRIAAQLAALPIVPLSLWLAGRRRATPLDRLILLCLLATLAVSVVSADQQGSLQAMGFAALLACLYVAAVEIAANDRLRNAVCLGGLAAILAWLVVFAVRWTSEKVAWISNGGGFPQLSESRQTLLWLSVNVVPVLVLVALPLLGSLSRDRERRVLGAALAILAVVVVPLSGGRAGWFGLAVAGIAYLALRMRPVARPRGRSLATVAAGAVAGLAIAVTLSLTVLRPLVSSVLDTRVSLWAEAAGIFASDPLTGGGPSTFSWLRLAFAPDFADRPPSMHAHNVGIQTLADGGLLLALPFFGLVALTLILGWSSRHALDSGRRLGLAALFGLAGRSLLDDHSALPAVTALIVIGAAFVLRPTSEGPRPRWQPPGWMLPVVATVLLVVAVPFAIAGDMARGAAEAGRAATLRDDWAGARAGFMDAVDRHPTNASYRLGLALATERLGDEVAARTLYDQAAAIAPGDARAWGGLAAIADSTADAIRLLDRAARLTADDPQYSYRLGLALAAEDREPEAAEALARAMVVDSTIVAAARRDYSGDVVDLAVEAIPMVIEELDGRIPYDSARLAGDLALAGSATDDGIPALHRALHLGARSEFVDALAQLRLAVDADRYAAPSWYAARWLARAQCDEAAAVAARRLAELTPGGGSRTGGLHAIFDDAYREPGLSTYEADPPVLSTDDLRWPDALLPSVGCATSPALVDP